MIRVDLYGTAHKGLAAELFETTALIARTDFSSVGKIALAVTRVRRALAFLGDHAEIQEQFILPELERLSPVLASEFHGNHTRLRGLEATISDLLARMTGAPEREFRSLGYRLHVQLRRLVAEHLLQMERAETTASRILWAHLTDDDLRSIRSRIVDSIPAPHLTEWMNLMMNSVSGTERTEIAQELGLPPEQATSMRGSAASDDPSFPPRSDEPDGDGAEELLP